MRIDHATVALVTGAAGGIGAAIAERLRTEGATVVTSDLGARGVDVAVDVTDRAAVRAAIARVVADHGHLDLAVACAGVGVAGLASEIGDADWDRSVAVNLTGTVNTVRAAYDVMLPRGRGQLVALASLSGLLPTPLLVPYATTKGGVVSLMTSLRPEAARNGIGVSVVSGPGRHEPARRTRACRRVGNGEREALPHERGGACDRAGGTCRRPGRRRAAQPRGDHAQARSPAVLRGALLPRCDRARAHALHAAGARGRLTRI